MRILITGGAGFIGSHVADRYLAEGHDVAVVDDLSSGIRSNVDTRVRFYEMDIQDSGITRVFEDFRPEVLSHHAAQMSVSDSVRDPLQDAGANILGTIRLMESAVRSGVGKVIFASSGGTVYGNAEEVPTNERSPLSASSPYGVSKISGEHYLRYYASHHGLPFTILRYSNVYGPRQNPKGEAGVVAIFSEHLLQGRQPVVYAAQRWGDGGCIRDYVYITDVANANLRALDQGDGQAINIGTGVPTRTIEIHRKLAVIEGTDAPARESGPRPGDLERNVLDVSLAQAALGWSAEVLLDEGLRITYSWWKEGCGSKD